MSNRGLTLEQKTEKINAVENLYTNKSYDIVSACKEVGISYSSYNNWKHSIKLNGLHEPEEKKVDENCELTILKDNYQKEIEALKQIINSYEKQMEHYQNTLTEIQNHASDLAIENGKLKNYIATAFIERILND